MEKRFDPMTGEPLQPQVPVQPQAKFDPMTGEPLQPQAAVQPEMPVQPESTMQFQATNQYQATNMFQGQNQFQGQNMYQNQMYQNTNQFQGQKSKLPFIIGGAFAAIVLIVVLVGTAIASGMFMSANDKVLLAFANTVTDKTELTKALDISDIVASGKYTLSCDGSYNENSVDFTYAITSKEQQLKGNASINGNPNIDFDLVLSSGKLEAHTSLLNNYLFQYDYNGTNTGYLMQQMPIDQVELFNKSLQELENAGKTTNFKNSEAGKALIKDFRDLKFEKVDAKDITIDDKTRSCKGYMTYIDKNTLRKFFDDQKAILDNSSSVNVESYNRIYADIEECPNFYMTVYIYKNKLAGITFKLDGTGDEVQLLFHGGDARWHNMELLANGESVMRLEGTKEGTSERYELDIKDGGMMLLSYDTASGLVSYNGNGINFTGVIAKSKNEFSFTLSYFEGLSGSISIKKGADIEKPQAGTVFDVGNASQEEIQSLFIEILGNIDKFGGLLPGLF